MQLINQRIRLLFFFSLGLSIGFPLGILGIVFGAVFWKIPLLVLGILLTVTGFYAMPLLWVRYADRRKDRTVLLVIERDRLYTVPTVAAQTGYNAEEVRLRIQRLILTRALVGYLFREDTLYPNTAEKELPRSGRSKKCDCCGATVYFNGVRYQCEYCHSVLPDDPTP